MCEVGTLWFTLCPLFIVSHKRCTKYLLLYNGNKSTTNAIAHSTHIKEQCEWDIIFFTESGLCTFRLVDRVWFDWQFCLVHSAFYLICWCFFQICYFSFVAFCSFFQLRSFSFVFSHLFVLIWFFCMCLFIARLFEVYFFKRSYK